MYNKYTQSTIKRTQKIHKQGKMLKKFCLKIKILEKLCKKCLQVRRANRDNNRNKKQKN